MGKGLLAWWRRRIVSRGLAGAALFAVPVAVAALIGFGTGLSSVAGGLTAVTSGPDAVPAAAQANPNKLNHAVVALANRPPRSATAASDGRGAEVQATAPGNGVSVQGNGSGSSGGTVSPSADIAPTAGPPAAPVQNLPSGDGGSGGSGVTGTTNNAVNNVNNVVDSLLGGVNQTLNGLLGR
jgi:hypothetical protein